VRESITQLAVLRQTARRWTDLDVRAIVLGELLFRAVATLRRSLQFEASGLEAVEACRAEGRRLVFVCWHSDDLAHLCMYHVLFGPQALGALLVPGDSDGRLMAWLAKRMGLSTSGLGAESSPTAMARGVMNMIAMVRSGRDALLAVDGPRGPLHHVKPGAAVMAQRAGAVLVPMSAAADRALVLERRWDRHLVPLPTSRLVVRFGPLIETHAGAGSQPSVEELQEQIGRALDDGARQAQRLLKPELAAQFG
jgi:lysophospholipid acyltransferase (LPLAT)-like uncharacterized protein